MQIKIDENETVITDNDVLGNAKECPKIEEKRIAAQT